MIINYLRTGGFPGGVKLSAHIDTATLTSDEARNLEQLVEEANFFALSREMLLPRDRSAREGGSVPDDFLHEVTIEREGRRHTVSVDDQLLPSSLVPLIDYLVEKAIDQARRGKQDRDN